MPGLGDAKAFMQPNVLRAWRLYGLHVHYFPLGWADKEAFEPKLKRILSKIDELTAQDKKVALIGISAGASAVINAYVERKDKISSLVYICGKIQNPQTVHERTFQQNPAFKDSMKMLENSLGQLSESDKQKMLSMRPISDSTVPVADTKLHGVREKVIFSFGHLLSIAVAITLVSWTISNFIHIQTRLSK